MSFRVCRVTLINLEGVRHTVEVTASTLYEAVALGILVIREQGCAGNIAEGLNSVDVSVINVPVTHSVMMQGFTKWLHRNSGTPSVSTGIKGNHSVRLKETRVLRVSSAGTRQETLFLRANRIQL